MKITLNHRALIIAAACIPTLVFGKDKAADAAWNNDMESGKKALASGQFYEASDRFTDALALAEKFGPEDSRLSETLQKLSSVHLGLQEYLPAQTFELRAVGLKEKKFGTNDFHLFADYLLLGDTCNYLKQYSEAEKYFRRAQALAEWKFGKYDHMAGFCLEKRAEVALSAGQFEDAEALYKQALPIVESGRAYTGFMPGSDVPAMRFGASLVLPANQGTVSSAWNGLGLTYRAEKNSPTLKQLSIKRFIYWKRNTVRNLCRSARRSSTSRSR